MKFAPRMWAIISPIKRHLRPFHEKYDTDVTPESFAESKFFNCELRILNWYKRFSYIKSVPLGRRRGTELNFSSKQGEVRLTHAKLS